MVSAISIPLFLIGVPLAFAGWRLYEGVIIFLGGMAGLSIGYITGVYLTNPGIGGNPFLEIHTWLAVFGMVAGMYAAYVAHRLVHGLSGFVVAALIGYIALDNAAVAVLLGLGGGYAAWMIHKFSVIVLTSVIGGGLVSLGFGLQDSAETQLFLASVIALMGMVVQFGLFGSYQPGVPGADEEMESCPSCGHPCERGDAYCQGCGESLCICGSCGVIGLQAWAFCDACGQSMETT